MRAVLASLALAAGLALPAAAQTAKAPSAIPQQGALMLLGPGLRHDTLAVWDRMVELAGGKGAKIVVVPAAAASPEAAGKAAVEQLNKSGASAVLLPLGIDRKAADATETVDAIRGAGGVLLLKGDGMRLSATLEPGGKPSPALEAIRGLHARGGIVAGIGPALGLLGNDWFADPRFLARGRFVGTLATMQLRGAKHGLGVEEDTAALVVGDRIEVLGYGGAVVVDLSGAQVDPAVKAFNLKGAKVTYLARGDKYDRRTGAVDLVAEKEGGRHEPRRNEPVFIPDVAGPSGLRDLLAGLMDGKQAEAQGLVLDGGEGEGRGHLVTVRKVAGSEAWRTRALGDESWTVRGAGLEVTPVTLAQPLYQPVK